MGLFGGIGRAIKGAGGAVSGAVGRRPAVANENIRTLMANGAAEADAIRQAYGPGGATGFLPKQAMPVESAPTASAVPAFNTDLMGGNTGALGGMRYDRTGGTGAPLVGGGAGVPVVEASGPGVGGDGSLEQLLLKRRAMEAQAEPPSGAMA